MPTEEEVAAVLEGLRIVDQINDNKNSGNDIYHDNDELHRFTRRDVSCSSLASTIVSNDSSPARKMVCLLIIIFLLPLKMMYSTRITVIPAVSLKWLHQIHYLMWTFWKCVSNSNSRKALKLRPFQNLFCVR